MFRFDIHAYSPWVNLFRQFIRHLVSDSFLTGKAFGVKPDDSSQFGNPDQLLLSQIAHPGVPVNRQHVMLTQAGE